MLGAGEPGGSRIPPKKDWSVVGGYIAYREPNGELVESEGSFRIENCTEERMHELMARIKSYTVMRVKADLRGTLFIEELIETDVTPLADEEALYKRYKTPITFNDKQFGEFVLNRKLGCFEGVLKYQNKEISVMLEAEDDIKTLHFICKDLDGFVENARRYAANNLLELGNQWQYDDAEDEEIPFIPMTEDDFIKRISLKDISIDDVEGGGEYTLWFDDGNIFWGHSITVSGNIESGFTDATMGG